LRTRTKIGLIVIVLLVFVNGLFYLVVVPNSRHVEALQFLGTPQLANGSATFMVTNVSNSTLYFFVLNQETKVDAQWFPIPRNSFSTKPIRAVNLFPHQCGSFVSTAPTNGQPWRVQVSWNYAPPLIKAIQIILFQKLGAKPVSYSPDGGVAYSPEVVP
jgi:hypothetical protein